MDRSFKQRFYLTLDEEADENMMIETIRNIQLPRIIEVTRASGKKFFGKSVKAIKISVKETSQSTNIRHL